MDERALNEFNAALERAEAILNSSSDAVILASLEGHIRQTNPAFDAMFGYSPDALYGQSLTVLVIDDYQAQLQDAIQEIVATKSEKRLELVAVRRDGSTFAIDIAIAFIPSKMHRTLGIVCSIRDMTYRKRIEEALQTTALRLQKLLANLQDGILLENADSRQIELANDAFCRMFNIAVSSEELVGKNCVELAELAKELFKDSTDFVERIEFLIQNRQIVSQEVLELRDGRVFERDYIPIFFNERHSANLWQYRDVTEKIQSLRRAERLRRIEKLHADIINQFLQTEDVHQALDASCAMVGEALDVSRVYVFLLRQNERLLDNTYEWCGAGVTPQIDNLQGLPFDDLVPSFFPLLITNGIIQAYDIRELPEDLYAILAPQQIKSILNVPLVVEERVEGFLGFDEVRFYREWQPEEVTIIRSLAESYARALERQRTEKSLIRLRDDALQAARLRSQFVSNMSHEIRTPMTGILGMLDLLLETDLSEEQREFAQTAHDSARHLLDIINSVLDFSKIDAGHVVLETEPFNVADMLKDVRGTLSVLAQKNRVQIHIDIGANVPLWIIGDLTRLRQVLINLAGNAVKFTHDGHVWLRVYTLGISSQQVRLRFEVEDTGIGIAPDQQKRIFESFVQADGTLVRKYGGTGLGLAIAKQLVELMGGEIDLKSAVGHGSTFGFSLTLPYQARQDTTDTEMDVTKHWQAIVLDEDDTARYVLAQQLASLGVTVYQVTNVSQLQATTSRVVQHSACMVLLRFKETSISPQLANFIQQLKLNANRSVFFVAICNQDLTLDVDLIDEQLTRPVRFEDVRELLNRLSLIPLSNSATSDKQSWQLPQVKDKQYTILLVEDRDDTQMLISRILFDENLQLDYASNGQEALNLLMQKPYDLVLMDIQMPVMTGIEAIKRIRSNEKTQNTPVVAITASVLQYQTESYLAMGFDAVLSKPFSIKQLREVVTKYLPIPMIDTD